MKPASATFDGRRQMMDAKWTFRLLIKFCTSLENQAACTAMGFSPKVQG
jgi:hypothetical protein